MCVFGGDMITATVEMVMSTVQAAYSFYQTTENIKVQKAQVQLAEEEAKRNAEFMRQKAIEENQEAIESAREQRLKTLQIMSSERANFAAGNLDLASQTSLDKLEDISVEGELDALNIIKKGESRAQKYLLDANSYESKAKNIVLSGKQKTLSLLGGLGNDTNKLISSGMMFIK